VRIAQFVGREREFTVNAARRLRTPLTALRLRLDAIDAQQPAGLEQETAGALREVDRLQATIDDLLTLARQLVHMARWRRPPAPRRRGLRRTYARRTYDRRATDGFACRRARHHSPRAPNGSGGWAGSSRTTGSV
jgi:signal transduction histidine kinase